MVFIIILMINLNATNNVIASTNFRIQGVPIISQHPELPTGCEATALTMLLNYYGVKVSKVEVAKKIPRVKLPYYIDENRYGSHPNQGFIGNPFSKHSYGVFAKPVLKTIEKYLPGRGVDLTGKSLEEVLKVVASGQPVMIWATIGMSNVTYTQKWKLLEGGEFKWPNNEHALVVVGYDDKYVYLNDPYTGGRRKFLKQVVTNRYNSLGKQAVTIAPEKTNLQLFVDGEKIVIDKGIISFKNEIMFPIAYLNKIGIMSEYYYSEKTIYLNLSGVIDTIQITGQKGETKCNLESGEEIKINYTIEDGITRINLRSILKLGYFNYKIEGNNIIIQRTKNNRLDNNKGEDTRVSIENINRANIEDLNKQNENNKLIEIKTTQNNNLEDENITNQDKINKNPQNENIKNESAESGNKKDGKTQDEDIWN